MGVGLVAPMADSRGMAADFSTWQLPGLINAEAPVALIDRNSQLSLPVLFILEGQEVDPLDPQAVAELSEENSCLVQEWKADVFCSSWISNCGSHRPACAELALVHDCCLNVFGLINQN